jgi:NADH dehydrogenase (ubiquinone) Fe-S protein 3
MSNDINISILQNNIPYIYYQYFNKENSLIISKKNLRLSLTVLKKHVGLRYNLLTCISGVDMLIKNYRFMIVYELLSISFNSRLKIKLFIDEFSWVISATKVFINADWWEREIWDLFGIYFLKHPDLRRILNDYSFEGYPLRKDFPVTGFVEYYYNNGNKNVTYREIQLGQESRAY